MERRRFFKSVIGTGVAAGAALTLSGSTEAAVMSQEQDYAMLVDKSACIGCDNCSEICHDNYRPSAGVHRTQIKRYEIKTPVDGKSVFTKHACQICEEAACVMSCPTGALAKNEFGVPVFDHSICVHCHYCINNCPYNAIMHDRQRGINEKCTMCTPLLREGYRPLCQTVCPVGAIHFGTREEMIELGEEIVAGLQDEGYTNAMVYGKTELGGLKVLSVIEENPEQYNMPKDPHVPAHLRAWNAIPFASATLVVGGAALAFNFIHTRKNKQLFEKPEEEDNQK